MNDIGFGFENHDQPSNSTSDIALNESLYLCLYYNGLSRRVSFYFAAVIMPIGVVFNMLGIIVSMRKSLRATRVGFYVCVLSVSNLITILFNMFVIQSSSFFGVDFATLSTPACKLIYYTRRIIRSLSPCLEVLFTVDLFVSVMYPRQLDLMRKYSLQAIGGLIILLVLFHAINIFFVIRQFREVYLSVDGIYKNFSTNFCTGESEAISAASDIILCIFKCALPIIIMCVLSVLIVRKMSQSSKTSLVVRRESSKAKKEAHFARTITFLNACFIVLNLPEVLGWIVRDYFAYFSHAYTWDDPKLALVNLVFQITFNLSVIYNTTFFFINLKFNKLFQREVKGLIFKSSENTNSLEFTNSPSSNK